MTAPSNANTSGLEVSLAAVLARAICESEGKDWAALDNTREDVERWFRLGEVTAASAQARIAELEAENDVLKVEVIGLRAAIFGSHDYDPALRHGNFIEMARATEDGRQGALARATAAEARADRLAKAGDRLVDALHRYGFPVSGGARVALTDRGSNEAVELDEAASNFRAALQQETQP